MPAQLVENVSEIGCIDQFYSGGPLALWNDTILAPCNASLKLIDPKNGNVTETMSMEMDEVLVTCVHGLKEDSGFVIATSDMVIRQYSMHKELVKRWKSGHNAIIEELSSLDNLLVSRSADRTCKVWDMKLSYCTHTLKTYSTSTFVCYQLLNIDASPHLICGLSCGSVMMWNLSEKGSVGPCLKLESIHSSSVTGILIFDDVLVTSSKDQTLNVMNKPWNKDTLKIVPVFETVTCLQKVVCSLQVDSIKDLSLSDPNDLCFCGTESGLVLLIDIVRSKVVLKINLGSVSPVNSIFPSTFNKSYWIVTDDLVVRHLDAEKCKVVRQLVGCNEIVLDICFMGEKDNMVVLATNSHQLRLYNRENKACTLLSKHKPESSVLCVDVPKWNANILASCGKDNTIRVWCVECVGEDSPKAQCVALATGHTNSVAAVKFSNIKCKFMVSVSIDKTLKMWSVKKWWSKCSYDSSGEIEHIEGLCTVVASDKDLTSVHISPNDALVVTGSMDKQASLWKVSSDCISLTSAGRISHPRGVWDVHFSPVDQVLATACGDGRLRLFALSDLSLLKTFESHDCAALRVRFMPSGLQLISSDGSGVIKLWSVANGECMKSVEAHGEDKIWALDVSSDGSEIVSGGEDKRVVFLRDVTQKEQTEAEDNYAQQVKQEQSLTNLVRSKKYGQALRLAINLGRPYNALNMVKEIVQNDENVDVELIKALKDMSDVELSTLLDYVVLWNTNTRNAYFGQRVLKCILVIYSPDKVLQLPNIANIIHGLIPYTQRHLNRLTELRQQAAFLKYTQMAMKLN